MLLSIFQHKWWEVGCKTSLSYVCITFVSPGNLDICLCWFGGVVRVYCTPVVKLMKMFSSFTHVLPICMCCLKLSWPPQDYSHTKAYPALQSITTHIVFSEENKLEVLVSPGEEFTHQPRPLFFRYYSSHLKQRRLAVWDFCIKQGVCSSDNN